MAGARPPGPAAALLAAALLAAALVARRGERGTGARGPAPAEAERRPVVSEDPLAPAARCARCHPHEAQAWVRSAHAQQARPRQQPPGGADLAVGSRWMQAYMRRDAEGLHRIVPRCYDLRDGLWREVPLVLAEIGGEGAGVIPHAPVDLAPRSFDLDCSGCHASGPRLALDPATGHHATAWRGIALDCETCHGGTPDHGEGQQGRAVPLGSLTPRARTMVCGRCHGGPAVAGDLEPADAAHFVTRLGERNGIYPDGTAAGQIYQVGAFVRSPCHVEGGLACSDCHEPHALGPIQVEGSDGMCVRCHADHASPVHTHHPPQSAGARCIECHMPRLLGGLMRHQREHRIGVPLPQLPDVPDACTACHRDRDEAWADAAWRRWWGEPPRERLASAAALAAARRGAGERAALRRALLSPDGFTRAAVLSHLPEAAAALAGDPLPEVRLAAVHALELQPGGTAALERYAEDAHPFVRASAWLALAQRGTPIPEARRADVALAARLDRAEVLGRRALARWALEGSRWDEAERWLLEWLALAPRNAEAWFLLADVAYERAAAERVAAAALHGVRAAFASGLPPELAAAQVEEAAAAAVQRGRRGVAHAVLGAAAEHAPLGELRGRFGRLLERLRRTP